MDPGNQLQGYITQLKQVEEALKQQKSGPDVEDLLQLKEDLTQLISLTAETVSTLSTEDPEKALHENENTSSKDGKSDLDLELSEFYKDISTLENDEDTTIKICEKTSEPPNSSNNDDELADFYSEINKEDVSSEWIKTSRPIESSSDPQNDKFLDSIESMNDISGVKCQAPFKTEWSGTQYHNAMIKGLAENDDNEEDPSDDIRVKVLFLNPVMQNMCPCPYYLDGNCKFDEDKCRFSHGYVVSLYELRPYLEPVYTELMEGSACLAKNNEGIWKPATVEKIEESNFHMRFQHKNITLCLELHDLLPQIKHHDETETLGSDDDVVAEIETATTLYSSCGSSTTAGGQVSIGLWEEHTKGIASKIMEKMGYKFGQGLGKSSQGRVEPVPIILLPPGKSLDHCMKIREEKGIRKINDRPGSTQETGKNTKHGKRNRGCVFSFLNNTLGGNTKTKTGKKMTVEKPKDMFGIKEGSEKKSSKNFNKEMFKNDEEMKKIKTKIEKVRGALKRNQGIPSVTKTLQEKLQKLKESLKSIQDYDSNIKVHKSRMETHRKTTMF